MVLGLGDRAGGGEGGGVGGGGGSVHPRTRLTVVRSLPPPKPAILFNDNFMVAGHTRGRMPRKTYLHICHVLLFAKDHRTTFI